MPAICFVSTVHDPFDSRVFYKIARTLARGGYAVTLLAPGAPDETIDGVRLKPLPPKPPARQAWKRWYGLLRVWRQARAEDADLYFIYDPEMTLVGLLLKLGGRKVIYDIHEHVPFQILDKDWIPRALRPPVAWLYDHYERLAVRAFDAVLPAFEQIADRFPQARRKMAIIRNVPELALWRPAEPGRPASDGAIIAVYSGAIQPDRCVLECVQAVNRLDPALNVYLWVIGPFRTDAYEAEVRAAAGERVRLWGNMRHDEVPALLAQAHIGLMSLRPQRNSSVNWPIKLFEYMAAGLPMIMHENPFWLSLAGESALAVNIEDAGSIAAGIAALAVDGARRTAMGARGRERAQQRYNWDGQAAQLLAVVRRLIGPPKRAAGEGADDHKRSSG